MICKFHYSGQPMGIKADEIIMILPSSGELKSACVVWGPEQWQHVVVDETSQEANRIWFDVLEEEYVDLIEYELEEEEEA